MAMAKTGRRTRRTTCGLVRLHYCTARPHAVYLLPCCAPALLCVYLYLPGPHAFPLPFPQSCCLPLLPCHYTLLGIGPPSLPATPLWIDSLPYLCGVLACVPLLWNLHCSCLLPYLLTTQVPSSVCIFFCPPITAFTIPTPYYYCVCALLPCS